MAKYIGARYVPKICGQHDKDLSYEPLSVVQFEGDSYTSIKTVPPKIEITNENYWIRTAIFSVQMEKYRQECMNATKSANDNVDNFKNDMKIQYTTMINEAKSDVNRYVQEKTQEVNSDMTELKETIKRDEDNTKERLEQLQNSVNTTLADTKNNVNSYLNQVKQLLAQPDNTITIEFKIPSGTSGDNITLYNFR